jgi:hypothetical protein
MKITELMGKGPQVVPAGKMEIGQVGRKRGNYIDNSRK